MVSPADPTALPESFPGLQRTKHFLVNGYSRGGGGGGGGNTLSAIAAHKADSLRS